jgi:hypothetical protein
LRKSSFIFAAAALFSVYAVGAAGQGQQPDPLKQGRLETLSRDLLTLSSENRERAQELGASLGWPVAGTLPGGRVFELQGFEYGLPFYYATFNLDAARTTRTDSVQFYIGGGSGFTIGLWDGDAPRMTHQELAPRVVWGDVKTAIPDEHATHVAGTMIARGVVPEAKGMAPEATIRAFQWDDDLAEMAYEASRGLTISNHSYGYIRGWVEMSTDVWYWYGDSAISETEDYLFGFYSQTARAADELLYAAPNYLPVLSAGNDRNDAVPPGTQHYFWDSRVRSWKLSTKVRDNDGAPLGYDCLPNGPAVAKNTLTIGAVEDVPDYAGPGSVAMTPFSSWGPTDDGRIKPDLCGNGWAVYSCVAGSDTSYDTYYGTSMASPNVCGSLGLLQDCYKDRHFGIPMRAATLKALAVHTAREAGPAPGPDYGFGWGLLDAYGAYQEIMLDLDDRKGLIEEYTLNDGVPIELYYQCDGTASELKVTICWTDPPGTSPAPALDPSEPMLVNDLDLRVDRDGATYEPWVLDPTDPASPVAKGDNFRDNVEQVHIASPEAGLYVVRIDHKGSLEGGAQDFSIVVSGAVRSRTWHVYANGTGDAPTIAAAVDSAGAGDQIFVYQGVFREHDIVVDKAVAIKGIRGAATTMVDAERLGRCFILPSGSGAVRIEGLTLKNGKAQGGGIDGCGGAVLSGNAEAEIAACVVTQSTARRGGGVYVDGGLGALRACKVFSNTAEESGGGVYDYSSGLSIDRCVIARNVAIADGGGIYFDGSAPSVVGSTVSHNAASGRGGGIFFSEGCEGSVENTIVAFTLQGAGAFEDGSSSEVSFACCDVYGNVAGDFEGGLSGQESSGGNFSNDPQFCDFESYDYRVGDGSPCLGAASPCGELVGALGAHCHSKTSWYVRPDGTGDATTIQAAVDRAAEGDTILIAAGFYSGEGNRDIDQAGKNLVIRSEKGADSTVVDCGGASGEIHWGFWYISGEDSTTVLDGLTIRHAAIGGVYCSGSSPVVRGCLIDSCITAGGARGGGMYFNKSFSKIIDCTVTNNRIDTNGGGIFCKESRMRLEGCTLSRNVAAQYGGGIAASTSAILDIVRCTVTDNLANTASGGGIYGVSAQVRIDSCTITGNTGSFGGGVYNGTNATCTIKHSEVSSNVARTGGGGVYSSTKLTMEDCTIVGNSAVGYGAGIESFYGDKNTIVRSIIAFNLLKEGIYTGSSTQVISCSDVYGNAGANYGGTTPDQTGKNGNISADPAFCDAGAFDYHVYDTSPCAPASSPCGQLIGARGVNCRIAPNLSITLVEPSSFTAPARSDISVSVVVKNTGVAVADSFYIDFYADRSAPPSPGQAGDRRRLVHSLAVGDTAVFTTGLVACDTIAAWKSYVAVDIDGWVVETDESDNAHGPTRIDWLAPREPGWPVPVSAGTVTSPLVVDLDGDAGTLEVIAGCSDGKLRAWSSTGDPLDGWPVVLGGTIRSSPAAGEIAGGSAREIVVSCDDGTIRAYSGAGVELWAFPISVGVRATPALADLDGDGKLEIICGSEGGIYALEGDGSQHSGSWPIDLLGFETSSAAIGDADGDGRAEIAVIVWDAGPLARGAIVSEGPSARIYLITDDGSICDGWPVAFEPAPSSDPVLGDIAAGHSRLEVVAAGENGLVYAWDADGNPCFLPCQVPGMIESSPALASFDEDGYLDIVVTSRRWTEAGGDTLLEGFVSTVSSRGDLLDSRMVYQSSSGGGALPAPIVIGAPPEALAGTPDGRVSGAATELSFSCCSSIVSTPAAADIDGDGWVEVFALSGDDSLYCYELCTSRAPLDGLLWPMFRRNPERTGSYGYEPLSGVDEDAGKNTPSVTSLRSVYPNPFNPAARVVFDVSSKAKVRLTVYDVSGRAVAILVDREMEPGRYEAVWNGLTAGGAPAASGVFFCRLEAGAVIETRKMVLVR